MLPFLKNKQEASVVGDEDEPDDFGAIDAVAHDIMEAVETKNKALLKSALGALCDYIKAEDQEQDSSLTNEEQ
jgi:hypothetical protein